jgi:hypothetical protein
MSDDPIAYPSTPVNSTPSESPETIPIEESPIALGAPVILPEEEYLTELEDPIPLGVPKTGGSSAAGSAFPSTFSLISILELFLINIYRKKKKDQL